MASSEDEDRPLSPTSFKALEQEQSEVAKETREKGLQISLVPHLPPKMDLKEKASDDQKNEKEQKKQKEAKQEQPAKKKKKKQSSSKDKQNEKADAALSSGNFFYYFILPRSCGRLSERGY